MENLVITLDGESVDLVGNETVAITYADFDLSDAATRNGAYTNTFKLPKTKRNLSIIRPYEKQACIIWARGIPLVNGYAAAATISDGIELNVVGQNADWFSEIAGKQLKDLNISELDHQRGFATLDPSTDGDIDWTNGYRYVPYNTGLCDTRFHEGFFTWELVHAYYARYIFEKIFNSIGWKVTGKGIEWPQFLTLMMTASVPEASAEYLELASFRANSSNPLAGLNTSGAGVVVDDFLNDDIVLNASGGFDSGTGFYTAQYDGFYDIAVKCQVVRRRISGVDAFMYDTVRIWKNFAGSAELLADDTVPYSGFGNVNSYRHEVDINLQDVYLAKGDTVLFQVDIVLGAGGGGDVQQWYISGFEDLAGAPTGTPTGTRYFSVTATAASQLRGYVFANEWLPNITQTEFILALANKYNWQFNTDTASRTVTVTRFDEILEADAIDWSEKVDRGTLPTTYTQYDKYGQVSRLVWKEDTAEREQCNALRDFGTWNHNGGKSYNQLANDAENAGITCENENLPETVDIITLPFAASSGGAIFTQEIPNNLGDVMRIGLWKLKDGFRIDWYRGDGTSYSATEPTDYVWQSNGKQWFKCINDNADTAALPTANWEEVFWPEIAQLIEQQEVEPRLFIQANIGGGFTQTVLVPDEVPYSPTFETKDVNFTGLFVPIKSENLLKQNYRALSGILAKTEVKELPVYLKPMDILSLDFRKPIKLNVNYGSELLNGLFYLNKVKEYNATRPNVTTCEFVKLNEPRKDYVVFDLDAYIEARSPFRWFVPDDLIGVVSDNTTMANYTDRTGALYITDTIAKRPVFRSASGANGKACWHFGVDTSGAASYTQFQGNLVDNSINGDFTIIAVWQVDNDYLTSGENQVMTGGLGAPFSRVFAYGAASNNLSSRYTAIALSPLKVKTDSGNVASAYTGYGVHAVNNDKLFRNSAEVSTSLNEVLQWCNLDTVGSSVVFYPPEKFKGKLCYLVAFSSKLTDLEIVTISDALKEMYNI